MNVDPSLDGAVRLAHLGIIRAQGADAVSFLQGQLTNDVAQLPMSRARLAGYCSAKGRLQASFVVWKHAPDEVRLACARDLLAPTLKRLSMFVLRAKCRLSDAGDELALWGRAGGSARELASALQPWHTAEHDGAEAIRLDDAHGVHRMLWVADANRAAPAAPALGLDAWRWLEVQSGLPLIEAATAEQFVPQMINFELVGGVDFRKGCYPGQEVVARSQYRGTVKRRMFLFDVDAPAAPGEDVFHSADPGQPAGKVVNAAPRPDGTGHSALVEVKLAALPTGALQLGAPGGPTLRLGALPYVVPLEADATA